MSFARNNETLMMRQEENRNYIVGHKSTKRDGKYAIRPFINHPWPKPAHNVYFLPLFGNWLEKKKTTTTSESPSLCLIPLKWLYLTIEIMVIPYPLLSIPPNLRRVNGLFAPLAIYRVVFINHYHSAAAKRDQWNLATLYPFWSFRSPLYHYSNKQATTGGRGESMDGWTVQSKAPDESLKTVPTDMMEIRSATKG